MNEIQHLKELHSQRMDYIEKAIILQAKEYERRLEALNHEGDQLKNMQTSYVSQDVNRQEKQEIAKDLRLLNTFKDNIEGRMIAYASVSFIIGIAITIALHFWK